MEAKIKKIIFIGAIPPPHHGVTIYNKNLLYSKINDSFHINHLDTSDHRNLDNLGKFDIRNLFLGLKNCLVLVIKIIRTKPDIIYLPISQNMAYLRDGLFIIISKLLRKKIIVHLHGSYFKKYYENTNFFIKRYIDFSLTKADAGIVLSARLKSVLDKWINNLKVVQNGVQFSSKYISKDVNNKLIVSYLGNISEAKGVMEFVNAAYLILPKYKNIEFRIAGLWKDESFKKKIYDFVFDKRLTYYIKYYNFLSGKEKEQFLLDTNIFVCPSYNEGQPLVILEAMAAGCVIISTRGIGAIPDMVLERKNGFLVNKKNPEEIAECIKYLIRNKSLINKMERFSRILYEKEYTLEKNIDNMIEVFKSI